ncbi:MAG: hypothetical protein MUE41_09785 [Gemmatimonadaceae bacterium]|jgi:hypothetical protein|nr:hypothetical protein [Gemmatimonadaceae bacterium]
MPQPEQPPTSVPLPTPPSPEIAAELARDLAQAAREMATAAQSATSGDEARAMQDGPMIVIKGYGGREIMLRNVQPEQLAALAAAAPPREGGGPNSRELAGMMAGLGVAFALAYPLVRALASRLARPQVPQRVSPEHDARLARIEAAVEAVSLEVERISEGQRFTTKLLSERSGAAPAPVFSVAPAEAVPIARTP